ncbi:phage holin family protein [Ferruginibacter sp. SUN002]|uniref:phage holin family protein n=1 Tax=Ferruginibacter sp. SUN002 TaxID=2937789 RepID=UPI003D36D2BE
MKNWLLKILVCSVNVFVLAYILPGVEIKNMLTALFVALVLSVLDVILKPLLILLTLPATILTLGLFLFVINACVILLGEHLVDGFTIDSFWHAMLFSILLSFFNGLVNGRVKVSVGKQDPNSSE